jgi:hypothetical protein
MSRWDGYQYLGYRLLHRNSFARSSVAMSLILHGRSAVRTGLWMSGPENSCPQTNRPDLILWLSIWLSPSPHQANQTSTMPVPRRGFSRARDISTESSNAQTAVLPYCSWRLVSMEGETVEERNGLPAAAGAASALVHRCFLHQCEWDVLLSVQRSGRLQPQDCALGTEGIDD